MEERRLRRIFGPKRDEAGVGGRRGAYRVLVGGSEGKRPLGIPRRRWEDNIKIELQEGG
jgi:hypothetical protein